MAPGPDMLLADDNNARSMAPGTAPGMYIAVGRTREVLAESHFGVVKSGTVTLEAAWLGLPMVILYRTGLLMGALRRTLGRFRALMPTRYLSLVNILAKQRLVDEIMPWHGNYRRLEQAVMRDMNDLGYLCDLRNSLMELVKPLAAGFMAAPTGSQRLANNAAMSPKAASENVARLVLNTIRRD